MIYIIFCVSVLLVAVIGFSYAYFTGSREVRNTLAVNVTIEEGLNANFVVTGNNDISINVSGDKLLSGTINEVAGTNYTNLTISLEAEDNVVCTYDLKWVWDSSTPNEYYKTSNVDKEFTLSGSNSSQSFNEMQVSDYNNTLNIGSYQIIANNTTVVQNWTFTANFYNANAVQDAHAGKTYKGKIDVQNAVCVENNAIRLSDTVTALVGTEETNADGTWMVVNDHGIRYAGTNPDNYIDIGEAYETDMYDAYINEVGMYASTVGVSELPAATPTDCNNILSAMAEILIQENLTATCQKVHSAGDPILWRIIGIFEEQYDTNDDNIPDTTGNLIKIIRDAPLGNYIFDYKHGGDGLRVGSSDGDSSNDWSDSQLMMMLNPPEFYKSGYDANGNQIHSDYTITTGTNTNSIYDNNNILIYKNMGAYWNANMTAYVPAETTTSGFTSTDTVSLPTLPASIQSKIATVKWHLGGISGNNLTQQALASDLYTAERGTNVYSGRPVYWYGKVGLIYPSDFAYATYGGSTYNRAACLAIKPFEWENDDYEDCRDNDWLYAGVYWALMPIQDWSTYVSIITDSTTASWASNADLVVKPVIYLAQNTQINDGDGSYANPYQLIS